MTEIRNFDSNQYILEHMNWVFKYKILDDGHKNEIYRTVF